MPLAFTFLLPSFLFANQAFFFVCHSHEKLFLLIQRPSSFTQHSASFFDATIHSACTAPPVLGQTRAPWHITLPTFTSGRRLTKGFDFHLWKGGKERNIGDMSGRPISRARSW
ncbi:hypothetical protein HDK77DRAFT_474308 [Phyllosticta capitalensis]|uniref:Secreted protein n=1 Tax=Phyllosticta capitalensis TaxID=121624 RepID=A0ABR1YJY7_9PEZI